MSLMDDKALAFWQEIARQVDKELLRDPRDDKMLLLFDRPKVDFWKSLIPISSHLPKLSDDFEFEARIGAYQQTAYKPAFYAYDLSVTRLELYGWDYIKREAAARRFEDDHDVW